MPYPRLTKSKLLANPWLHLLALFLLLFLFAWPSITSLLFWVSDTGLRFLQIRELIDHGWRTFAIDYPARPFDPDLQHVPYYYAYRVIEGELYLSITPFFPLLASFLYVAVGKAGLVLLPVLGGVFSAAGTYRVAKLAGLHRPLVLMWGAVFLTPVLFYSMELWDHTIAVALTVWAVVLVVQGAQQETGWPLLAGGVLVSLAIGQRGEVLVFALALGLGLLTVTLPRLKPLLLYGLGGLLGMVPVALLNILWVGHPLGLTLANRLFDYGVPDAYPVDASRPPLEGSVALWLSRVVQAVGQIFHPDPGIPLNAVATILAALSIVLVVLALRRHRPGNSRTLALALALLLPAYTVWFAIGLKDFVSGLASSFYLVPFTLTFLWREPQVVIHRQVYRLLAVATWSFVLLTLLLTLIGFGSYGGAQWGSRYLLPVYPLLLILAFYVYEHLRAPSRPLVTVTFAVLLLLTLVFQLHGARLMYYAKKVYRQPPDELIASLPAEVILTNDPRQLPSLSVAHEEKIWLWVNDEEEIARLAKRLAKQGVTHFALLDDKERPLIVPGRADQILIHQVNQWVYQLNVTGKPDR